MIGAAKGKRRLAYQTAQPLLESTWIIDKLQSRDPTLIVPS
jgi:hypothetical protein